MATKSALLPKNWRKQIPAQIQALESPDLLLEIDDVDAILGTRPEAEVVGLADDLWQRLAHKGSAYTALVPRFIHALHADTQTFGNTKNAPLPASLVEHLAVATLVETWRACQLFTTAKDQTSWKEAAKALANARTLSDWIYLLSGANVGNVAFGSPPFKQVVRAAAKEKLKKAKSEAATKGWRKQLKQSKQLVFEYYEQHKTEFKSLPKAAAAISAKKLVHEGYSTIYTWLRKYKKKQAAASM